MRETTRVAGDFSYNIMIDFYLEKNFGLAL